MGTVPIGQPLCCRQKSRARLKKKSRLSWDSCLGAEQPAGLGRYYELHDDAESATGVPAEGPRPDTGHLWTHVLWKSTELMRRVRRFQIAQYKCLLIKYAKDTRYCANGVSTHDRNTMEALSACCLKDVQQEALNSAVIGIDEGQFFPDIVEFCETMANAGKTVIVAALDGTFQRKAFGNILQLVPLAESVVKLNAVCMECYHEASYTKRLGTEKEVEIIGGADKYHSVCRVCYFKNRQQLVSENKENLLCGNKHLDISASRKVLATRQIMQWNPSN